MAAKKKAKPKKKAAGKKAVKKTAKKAAKRPIKKKAVKKATRKVAKKKAVKKVAKKAVKKPVKKVAKKIVKAAKPKSVPAAKTPKATKGTPVTFVLDAPYGWDVSLAGNFSNWEPRAMIKDTDGKWRLTVHLAPGTYQYRFLVDTEWRDDPTNARREINEYGGYNSIIDVA